MDCSPLDTSLFEAANPYSALLAASWVRDLSILRRTEYADLGNLPTESKRSDAWQDPLVDNSNNTVISFHHHQIQMLCWHVQLQTHNVHRIL